MKRIVDTSTPPYGGMAIYKDRETGISLNHPNISVLIERATQLRVQNNLPIPVNWEEHVEDNICLNTPGAVCEDGDGAIRKAAKMAVRFTKAMVAWGTAGFPLVSDEVLSERRLTCEGGVSSDGIQVLRCDRWQARPSNGFGFGRCGACGCVGFLKSALSTEKCPLNKWRQ